MFDFLKGHRTKILAAGTVLVTIAGLLEGSVSLQAGIAAIMTALGTLTARAPGAEAAAKLEGK